MSAVPAIRLESVNKTFVTKNGSVEALKNVSLEIQKGWIFGVIGQSGAGKSTLVRCVNHLEKPTSGEVYIEGKPLSGFDNAGLRDVRRSIGMIFQQFNLLMQRTALRNIMYPLEIAGVSKQTAREKALALLERVGLPDKANAYPAELSGGQKQRVAIARALATDPTVLLCDEATSALDPVTTRSILALIKDLSAQFNITVVVITHEMRVVEEICSHFAIVNDGGVVETGTVQELFTSPKTAAAKRLIFPEDRESDLFRGTRCCRVVFNGNSAFEPVIADLVLESGQRVNILFADTKNIDGKAFGEMILQFPQDSEWGNTIARLQGMGLSAEEVDYPV